MKDFDEFEKIARDRLSASIPERLGDVAERFGLEQSDGRVSMSLGDAPTVITSLATELSFDLLRMYHEWVNS
ncbi:MAG: hypothetical protein PHS28_05440 [Atopobiaceae bacterium]|jgi:hypothetical protein|nr:hypothetical protein [Atopobiaceae bacterium]